MIGSGGKSFDHDKPLHYLLLFCKIAYRQALAWPILKIKIHKFVLINSIYYLHDYLKAKTHLKSSFNNQADQISFEKHVTCARLTKIVVCSKIVG